MAGSTNDIIHLLFQFPPLREGRRKMTLSSSPRFSISIPAPARGATLLLEFRTFGQHDFNSRPCARGDTLLRNRGHRMFISIPAPARGATFRALRWQNVPHYFNSRPCARGDAILSSGTTMYTISIPAPARGATELLFDVFSQQIISIPAPARGATANLNKSVLRNLCEQANSKDACLLFYDM